MSGTLVASLATPMTVEGVPAYLITWAVLAFGVWLVLLAVVRRLRLRGGAVLAAALRWVVAWATMRSLPLLLQRIGQHLFAPAGGAPWR